MRGSSKIRLAIATILSVLGLVLTPSIAAADVCPSCNGALVVNQTTSSNILLIWNGSQTATLQPGQTSERFTYWQDVDAFQSPYCNAQRYENGRWTTVYQRGVWYYITNNDSSSYSIRVAWC